jgi:hypothetical protein
MAKEIYMRTGMIKIGLSAVLILAGCGNANWSSIYRETPLTQSTPKTKAVFMDAQERVLIASAPAQPNANIPGSVIVCAEPSPDAITVLSSSFAASVKANATLTQSGDAQLQSFLAGAATALGHRNSTIQLFRDLNYTLCEARMNGFVDEGSYSFGLNRSEDAMVTLLATEQLTSPYQQPFSPIPSPSINPPNAPSPEQFFGSKY